MKKTIILLVLGLIIVPGTAIASIDNNLKYGQKSSEIVELQDFLIEKGILLEGNNTGFFGTKTLKAVKEYQTSVRVPATGYVGVMTRSEINKELQDMTASSTEAEIKETGTSTPVVKAPVVQQPIIQYVYVPMQTITTPVPTTQTSVSVVETPKYVITGPEYSCKITSSREITPVQIARVVTFRVTDNPSRFKIMASSTTGFSTANQEGVNPYLETYFSETKDISTYNYTIFALGNDGAILSEKSGTFDVDTETCKNK